MPAPSVSLNDPTAAAGRQPSRVRALLAWAYMDTLGIVSRPKVLFTVALADVLAMLAAGHLASVTSATPLPETAQAITSFTAIALALLAMLNRHWSYTIAALGDPAAQAPKVFSASVMVFAAAAALSYVTGVELLPPGALLHWFAYAIAFLLTVRVLAARCVQALTRAGLLVRRTVVVGGGKDSGDLIDALAGDVNLAILGIFDDRQGARVASVHAHLPRLGTFEELAAFCRNESVDLAIVTVPARAEERLLHILQRLFSLQVDIRISALTSRIKFNASAYTYIGKVPMLAVMDKPLNDWDRLIKNIEDRVLGAFILLAVSPIMALVAIAVRLDSKGPVFFKQRRYGFNNELIEVYKFRSMYAEQSDANAARLVTKGDSRVTRVGRFIRKTSLDELPQLFNVLLGEMSLVGPRPHATQAKAGEDLYENVVQGYFARHRVKPGVTGWAQIKGWRGETDTADKIERRVECDLYYIDHWSVGFDLYILAITPFALLSAKNAY